jgi:hypothetical protein
MTGPRRGAAERTEEQIASGRPFLAEPELTTGLPVGPVRSQAFGARRRPSGRHALLGTTGSSSRFVLRGEKRAAIRPSEGKHRRSEAGRVTKSVRRGHDEARAADHHVYGRVRRNAPAPPSGGRGGHTGSPEADGGSKHRVIVEPSGGLARRTSAKKPTERATRVSYERTRTTRSGTAAAVEPPGLLIPSTP